MLKKVAGFIGAFCFVLVLSGCVFSQRERPSVSSPNGRNRVSVFVEQGQLYYTVERDGRTLLAPSRLGLRFKKHTPLGENVHLVSSETGSYNESWEQIWGEQQWVTNRYEELLLTVAENGGEQKILNIRIRVYDDGFGFRYEVPEQSGVDEVAIMDEITEFHFPSEGTAWWTPGNSCFYEQLARVTPICEVGALKHEMEVGFGGTAPNEARPANTPITIKTAEGCYLTIHEAALLDYAAMNLSSSNSTTLRCELTPWSTGEKVLQPFRLFRRGA
jgi:alpha-glucosidase